MAEAFICDAARTPIGRYGGALSGVRTDDLAAIPIKALVYRNRFEGGGVRGGLPSSPVRLAFRRHSWNMLISNSAKASSRSGTTF
jgi:hypothetical protein